MKKLLLFLFLNLSLTAFGQKYLVKSAAELNALTQKLQPGDEVVIADGTYTNWNIEIPNSGKKGKEILFKAEHPGKVSFTGEVSKPIFLFSGKYVTLSGIYFKECTLVKVEGKNGVLVEMRNTVLARMTNCHFINNTVKTQFTPLAIISGNGMGNIIDSCSFIGNIDNQDVQVKITNESCPTLTVISDNLFQNKNKVSWKNENGGECVQIGQDPVLLGNKEAVSMVIRNRFINCNGESEIISNKSSKNTYSNNYFENNDGELVMRGGHNCQIDGNIFNGGTGGIRINGTGHKVMNNKISKIKTAIRLMYGMAKGTENIGFYIAASDCSIIGNEITNATTGILVGDSKDADWTGKFDTKRYPSPVMQNIAPFNNKIENNKMVNTKNPIVTVN
jgi:poly(beta-D-mannuronate) lyase